MTINQGSFSDTDIITSSSLNGCLLQFSVAASRDSAGQRGRMHLATDTGALTYDDGTAWQSMGFLHTSALGINSHHNKIHKAEHEPSGGDTMTVDAATGTGSLRTLGTGAQQAAVGDHAHTFAEDDSVTTNHGAAFGGSELDGVLDEGGTSNTLSQNLTVNENARVAGVAAGIADSGVHDIELKIDGTSIGTHLNHEKRQVAGSRNVSSGTRTVQCLQSGYGSLDSFTDWIGGIAIII